MKKIALLSFVGLWFCVVLCSCSTTAKFEDCVVAGDYAEAISIYESKISGNIEKEHEAQDFMWTYIGSALSDYAEGTIDIDKAENSFNCISKINETLSVFGADFYYLYEELGAIRESKENFKKAIAAVDSGDYETAAELFIKVSESDKQNYEEAMAQLVHCNAAIYEEANHSIDQYIASEEYERAINTFRLFAQGYAELVTDEMMSKISNCEERYRNQVIDQSIKLYHSDGAEAANAVINQGLQLLLDDQQLINVSNLYQSVAEPASFKSLTGRVDGVTGLWGADKTDSMGHDHSSKNMIYFFGLCDSRPTASISRNTYGTYTKLTGTMYFLDTAFDMSASMKIYADGAVVFDSGVLNKEAGGTNFDVDVSDVYSIKIELSYVDVGQTYAHCFLDNVYVSRKLTDEEIYQAAT